MVILFSLIGMLCWGIAPLFLKLGLKDINPLIGLAIRTTFTLVIISGWMVINGGFFKLRTISSASFLLIVAEAIFATLIGDLAYFIAIKSGEVSLVTIIMCSSPLVTILCSIFFLGEQVTLARIIGLILIIVGVVIAL